MEEITPQIPSLDPPFAIFIVWFSSGRKFHRANEQFPHVYNHYGNSSSQFCLFC